MNLIAFDCDTNVPVCSINYGSHDASIIAHCDYLKEILSEEAISDHYAATGTVLVHPCYAYSHLHRLYTKHDYHMRRIYWTTIASYISSQWTGSSVPISISEAAWTGLLNLSALQWSSSVTSLLPLEHLPCIQTACTQSTFTDSYIKKWPEVAGARIYGTIGDGYAANLGSSCGLNSGRIAVTIGTTAAARIVLPRHISIPISSGLWQYAVNEDEVVVGGSLTDGGSLLAWLGSIVGEERLPTIINSLRDNYEAVLSPQHGQVPISLPFLSGERSTGYQYAAAGNINYITHATTAEDLLRSMMEGCMLRLNEIIKSIVSIDRKVEWCIAGSGLVLEAEQLWRQMLADITGCTVLTLNVDANEATTRGIWRHIQHCNGTNDTILDSVATSTTPIPAMRDYYAQRREKHISSYNNVTTMLM